jgi:hypothetical protein
MSWLAFCISICPRGATLGMKGQEHDKAEEFAAEAHKPLAQEDDQGTAAFAAWAITETGPDRREIPAPRIVPPGVPGPRLPGVGPLPGP